MMFSGSENKLSMFRLSLSGSTHKNTSTLHSLHHLAVGAQAELGGRRRRRTRPRAVMRTVEMKMKNEY